VWVAAVLDPGERRLRRLHLSVRAVTYRLHRIRQLTGYDLADPEEAFALQTAVLGARLLDRPRTPLPT